MRFLMPAVASLLVLGFACAGDEETEEVSAEEKDDEKAEERDDAAADAEDDAEAAPPRGKAGRGGHGRRGVDFAEAKVVCCDHDRVNKALKEYLDVQQNLYKDQPSTGDANALWGHLDTAAGDATLPRTSRDIARKAADEVAKYRDEDNATMRKHFDATSIAMHELVEAHKGGGDYTVAYTYCPRGGGHWYQSASTIQSPYDLTGNLKNCGQFQP